MRSFVNLGLAALALLCFGTSAQAAESSCRLSPYQTFRLTNGLTLILMEKHEIPLISMAFTTRAGSTADPAGKEGLASITAEMLRRGTASRSADEISAELDFIGASFEFGAGYDHAQGGAEFLKKDLAVALDLVADILRHPNFPEAELTKLIRQNVDGLKQEKDEPGAVIRKYFNTFLYGGHPYARPVDGDENTLAGLTRDDAARFYRAHYGPQVMTMAIVGDFKSDEMRREMARRFEDWEPSQIQPAAALTPPASIDKRALLLVDKPDSTQTYFCLGNIGIAITNRDRVAIELVNTLFGGRFTSLLNDALRVNSGYTYGAGSRFERRLAAGPFLISSFTPNTTTVPAIDLALEVLKQLREKGLTDEQITSAKAYLKGQYPQRVETTDQLAGLLVYLDFYGLDRREVDDYFPRVDRVTREETQRVIREYFPRENLVFVLVGKAAEIKSAVAKYAPQLQLRDISQAGYR